MKRNQYDWTPKIDKFLKENYASLGCAKCSDILGIPYRVVQGRALKKLKISKFSHINWTPRRLSIVKHLYSKYGGRYVSNKLKLPITSINKKANEMGIKYAPKDRYICSEGYIVIGKSNNRIAEHRAIMESMLGRKLTSREIVHHKDEDKLNNDPSNLELTTRKEHINHHRDKLNQAKI